MQHFGVMHHFGAMQHCGAIQQALCMVKYSLMQHLQCISGVKLFIVLNSLSDTAFVSDRQSANYAWHINIVSVAMA